MQGIQHAKEQIISTRAQQKHQFSYYSLCTIKTPPKGTISTVVSCETSQMMENNKNNFFQRENEHEKRRWRSSKTDILSGTFLAWAKARRRKRSQENSNFHIKEIGEWLIKVIYHFLKNDEKKSCHSSKSNLLHRSPFSVTASSIYGDMAQNGDVYVHV